MGRRIQSWIEVTYMQKSNGHNVLLRNVAKMDFRGAYWALFRHLSTVVKEYNTTCTVASELATDQAQKKGQRSKKMKKIILLRIADLDAPLTGINWY